MAEHNIDGRESLGSPVQGLVNKLFFFTLREYWSTGLTHQLLDTMWNQKLFPPSPKEVGYPVSKVGRHIHGLSYLEMSDYPRLNRIGLGPWALSNKGQNCSHLTREKEIMELPCGDSWGQNNKTDMPSRVLTKDSKFPVISAQSLGCEDENPCFLEWGVTWEDVWVLSGEKRATSSPSSQPWLNPNVLLGNSNLQKSEGHWGWAALWPSLFSHHQGSKAPFTWVRPP